MKHFNHLCTVQKIRQVLFYKSYFQTFFLNQSIKVQHKILWTLKLIEEHNQVTEQYLKHLNGAKSLYEIRVQSGSDIFRIFCFFDKGLLIVIINGFQKKSQKTPQQEIEKALRIKGAYENAK